MIKNNFSLLLLVAVISLASACQKGPGDGGTSTIKGRIWVRQYDPLCSTLQNAYWGYKQNVYIQYGDGVGLNANGGSTTTDNNGYFQFEFLRKGTYKVYIYSDDSTAIVGPPLNPKAPQKSVEVKAEVTKRKQTVDLGSLTIIATK